MNVPSPYVSGIDNKTDNVRMYNVTLCRVRVTIVAMEKQ